MLKTRRIKATLIVLAAVLFLQTPICAVDQPQKQRRAHEKHEAKGQPAPDGQREVNRPAQPAADRIIAITGAKLIDGRGGEPLEEAVVIVRGNRIDSVGKSGEIAIPEKAKRIDATGKSLLPGLIDTHFHSRNDLRRPADYALKRGVTSFRDPGHKFCNYDLVIQTKRQMPRVFLTGGHFDAAPVAFPDQAAVVKDAAHAKRKVKAHVARGATAIKLYFGLPLEHIRAACEACDEHGVIATAHLELVDADDAIRAGVDGIEHVTSFGTALAEPDEIKEFKSSIADDPEVRTDLRYRFWAQLDLEHSTKVKPLIDLIIRNGVFVSPTIAIFEQRADSRLATSMEVAAFENMLKFIGLCHESGAKIVVGSHTSARHAKRGRAYQRELELLVQAGLSPTEAIVAGTSQGAAFLGTEDRLGTIESGKTADLILVTGDPTEDISDIGRVNRVMLNGSWVKGVHEPDTKQAGSALRIR